MFTPEKMKHNAFKRVRIPKPIEIFGRVGLRPVNPSGYTGEETLSQMSKLQQIREAADREMEELRRAEEERRRREVSSSE